ncbi:MAG: M23 family metallopeptidase [Bacillota bacterium]
MSVKLIRGLCIKNRLVPAALTLIFSFLAIFHFYQSYSFRQEAYFHLSRLPAEWVITVQEAAGKSSYPWELAAAYYQVLADYKHQGYPAAADVSELFKRWSAQGLSSYRRLIMAGFAEKRMGQEAWVRFRQLAAVSGIFSDQYLFPAPRTGISFIDTWGADRDGGRRRHQGTDIFAREGTPLYACVDGTIARLGWNELGGKRIGLKGKDGIYYYYAHLQDYAPGIKQGDQVRRGTLIGFVGHTGNAENTPDHLHFGMMTGWDEWINPYNFLNYWHLTNTASTRPQ